MSYKQYMNQYQYKMNAYDKKYIGAYNKKMNEFENKYMGGFIPSSTWNSTKVTNNLTNKLTESYYNQFNKDDDKRSPLDRFFDAISVGQYVVQGAISGAISDDETVLENIWEGIKGANPFGRDYKAGEFYFSDNLSKLGWQPETTLGKIAKGGLGIVGDIVLDPTTYLTGGFSALGKGSGKAGKKITQEMVKNVLAKEFGEEVLKKNIKDIPEFVYKEVMKRSTKVGTVSNEALERFAIKKANEARHFLTESIGMSEDLASKIVKRTRPELRGDELRKEAIKLSNSYNDLYGLNKSTNDITFSLQNLPFGRKLFPNANIYNVAKADTLSKIGDYTFAPLFQGIRSSIKASKIAKLFDTSSDIYKIAKNKPEELYNVLRHISAVTGYNKELVNLNQEVMKIVNEVSELSPSENKQLLEILQDKKMFVQTMRQMNFMESEEVLEYVKNLEHSKNVLTKRLEKIKETNDLTEYLRHGDVEAHMNLSEVLDELKRQKSKLLEETRINGLSKQEDIESFIKEAEMHREALKHDLSVVDDARINSIKEKKNKLTDEIKRYDEMISDVEMKISNIKEGKLTKRETEFREKLKLDLIEMQNKKIEFIKMQEDFNKLESMSIGEILSKRFKDIEAEIFKKKPDRIKRLDSDVDNLLSNQTKSLINDVEVDKLNKSFERNISEYYRIVDDVSEMLTGKAGLISKTTRYNDMKPIIEMIETNYDVDLIIDFINTNPEKYGGKFSNYYKNVAKYSGYTGSWQKFYNNDEINKLRELRRIGKLDFDGYVKLAKRESVSIKRARILQETRGMSYEDAMKYFNKIEFEDMYKQFDGEDLYKRFQGRTISEMENYIVDLEAKRAEANRPAYAGLEEFEKFPTRLPKKESLKLTEELEEIKLEVFNLISKDKAPTPKHIAYAERVANRYSKLYKDKYLSGVSNLDFMLSKEELFNKALKDVFRETNSRTTGDVYRDMNKIVEKNVTKHMLSDLKRHISDVKDNLKEGFEVTFKSDDKTVKGVVSTKNIDISTGLTQYSIKTDNGYIVVSPRDILTYGEIDFKKYDDVIKAIKDNFIESNKMKLYEHFDEMNHVDNQIKELTKKLKSADKRIESKLNKLLKDKEELLNSKTLLEDEYSSMAKIKRSRTTPEIQEYNKKISYAKNRLKRHNETLIKRIDDISNSYNEHIQNTMNALKDVEKKLDAFQGETASYGLLTSYADSVKRYEKAFASTEALETYIKSTLSPDKIADIENNLGLVETGRLVLEDLPIDEKVKKLAFKLRDEFIRIGKEEVGINKLKKEQLDELMMNYVPHILTPEGRNLVNKNKEFSKYASSITQDFGYGRVKNPYAKSRTITSILDSEGNIIKNPTIEQINEFFSEKLKGKNLFSENVAEIYLTRAIKHNELMYDDTYMREMMGKFGTAIENPSKYVKRNGYKPVVNYGHFKDNIRQVSTNKIRRIKSDIIADFVKSKHINSTQEEIINAIKEFSAENFTKEWHEQMYDSLIKENLNSIKVTPKVLDELAVPMVELDGKQVSSLHMLIEKDRLEHGAFLKKKLDKAVKRGVHTQEDAKYIQRIEEEIRNFESFKRVEMFEINDAIVNKSNQLRKAQILKDKNNFLKLFDKATYFIKLNQTTVLPSFHARNIASNVFLQYLGMGGRAFDLNLKKKAFQMAKTDGKHEVAKTFVKYTDELGNRSVKTLGELWEEAKALGVVDSGVFAQEYGATSASKGILKSMNGKFDPTDTNNFFAYKKGAEFGSRIEFMDRFMFFVTNIESGKTFEQSRDIVNKYMLDYSDVTAFEQSVMKRIIPYYTWMKKNASIQLSEMIQNPHKYQVIAKISRGIENMSDREARVEQRYLNDFALDWIQLPFKIRGKWGQMEQAMWNPAMPYMDVSKYPLTTNLSDLAKALIPNVNPLLKVPVEIATNHNTFFDDEIVKEGANPTATRIDYAMSQLTPYSMAKDFTEKSGTDLKLHTLNALTGVRILSYDYDSYKKKQIYDALNRKREALQNK